jgi:hypothetical protein
VKSGGSLLALALCSACASAAVAPTTAALGRPITAARLNPMPRYATIFPERQAKSTKYEYIFNTYDSYASIFDYPKSDKQIGKIDGDGGQGCTNVLYGYGKKIFWNVGGNTQITEYKVPQTPIKTLSVDYSFPTSCAMDSSGDLAVGIYDNGDVLIFKNASGSPTVYKTPLDEEFFDGYDPSGDLFADGFTGDRYGFMLVELPKGSSTFETITTSNKIQFPGSVQWDGTYVTVVDQLADALYQYTVSGTKAKLKGTVSLSDAGDCAQTWIATGVLFCGDAGNEDGEVYKYPAGGSPIAVFTGDFDGPLGATAAEK